MVWVATGVDDAQTSSVSDEQSTAARPGQRSYFQRGLRRTQTENRKLKITFLRMATNPVTSISRLVPGVVGCLACLPSARRQRATAARMPPVLLPHRGCWRVAGLARCQWAASSELRSPSKPMGVAFQNGMRRSARSRPAPRKGKGREGKGEGLSPGVTGGGAAFASFYCASMLHCVRTRRAS